MGIINYPYTPILTLVVCCYLDIADLIFSLWRMLLGIKMNQGPLQKNASWMFSGMNRSRRRTKIWTDSTYMEAHCSMFSVCQELPYKNLLTLKVQNPLIFLKPFWFKFVNQLVCSRVASWSPIKICWHLRCRIPWFFQNHSDSNLWINWSAQELYYVNTLNR